MAEARPRNSRSLIKEVQDDFLTCPVCLDIYEDPRILPCAHRICFECLKGIAGTKLNFPCPEDRQNIRVPKKGINGFRKDFKINGLVEKFNEEQEDKGREKLCSVHKLEEVVFFCKTCSMNICQKCVTTNHQKHLILSIEDAWVQEIQPLAAGVSTIRSFVLPQIKQKQTFIDKYYQAQSDQYLAHVKKVRKTAAVLKKIIDEQSTSQIEALKHKFSTATIPWRRASAGLQEKEHTIIGLSASIESLQECDPWALDLEEIDEFKVKLDSLASNECLEEINQTPRTEYNAMLHDEDDASLYSKFMNSFGDIFKVKEQAPDNKIQRNTPSTKERFLTGIPTGFTTVTDLVVTPSGKIVAANGKMLKIFEISLHNQNAIVHKTTIATPAQFLDVYENEIIAASQFSLSYISEAGEVIKTNDLKTKHKVESIIAHNLTVDRLGGTFIGVHPIQLFVSECSAKIYKILYKGPPSSSFKKWRTGYGSLRSMCCTPTNELIISLYQNQKISVQRLNVLHCCWKFTIASYQESLPCPVDCDDQGFIYVADNANSRVIKLTSSGLHLSDITTREDGLHSAAAISISRSMIILGYEDGTLTLLPQNVDENEDATLPGRKNCTEREIVSNFQCQKCIRWQHNHYTAPGEEKTDLMRVFLQRY